MNNDEFVFNNPEIVNNEWYVFKDAVLSDIHINDCNTSVTGICERTKNLQDCLNICKNQQPCKSGYYIETKTGNISQSETVSEGNICVPLRESNVSSSAGPYYRLRNKSIYPVMKDMKTFVFSNISDPFPPKHVNNIFYSDSLQIKLDGLDKFIGLDEEANDISDSQVISDPVDVQIIPSEILAASISRYIIVKHGDFIQINIPRTAYILTDGDDNKIIWKMRASLSSNERSFQIFSATKDKKIGDYLNYDEKFYLLYEDIPVYYNPDFGELMLAQEPLEKLITNKKAIYFRMIPKVKGYYCDNKNDLKSIDLDKTIMKGETASFNGKEITRSPTNWNKCRQKSEILEKIDNINNIDNVYFLIVILFLIFLIFKKFFGMKRKKLKK
jgi:hypothetical protein